MDDLSREDLIAKCKHYLSLAQKAKQAKDDAFKKVEELESKLHESKTLEEEKTEKKVESKSVDCIALEEQLESCKRRNAKLSEENDKLLESLDFLEDNSKILKEKFHSYCKDNEELKNQNKELQEKLKEANQTRDSVVRKLEEVSVETRLMIENCERISDENEVLKQQVVSLLDEKKTFEIDIEKLREQLMKVSMSFELTKQENSDLQKKCKSLNQQYLEKVKEVEKLSLKCSEGSQYEECINNLTLKIQALETQNSAFQQEISDLSENYSSKKSLDGENELLKKELKSKDDSLLSVRKELENLKTIVVCELTPLISENEGRMKDLFDAKNCLNDIRCTKLVNLKDKIIKLRSKNKALIKDNTNFNLMLSEKTHQNEELSSQVCNLSTDVIKLKEEIEKLTDYGKALADVKEKTFYQEQIPLLEEKAKFHYDECRKALEEKSQLLSKFDDLKAQFDILGSEHSKLKDEYALLCNESKQANEEGFKSLAVKYDRISEECLSLKSSLEELQSQQNELVSKNSLLASENEKLKVDFGSLQEEKHLKESMEKELNSRVFNLTEERDELKLKNDQLQTDLNVSEKELQRWKSDFDHSSKNNVELKERIEALVPENNQLSSEVQEQKVEIKNLKSLIEVLQADNKSINEKVKKDTQNYLNSIQKLETEVKDCEEENEKLKTLISENQQKIEKLSCLENEILKFKEKEKDYQSMKEALNEKLDLYKKLELENKALLQQNEGLKPSSDQLNEDLKECREKAKLLTSGLEKNSRLMFQKLDELKLLKIDLINFISSSKEEFSTLSSTIDKQILEKLNIYVENTKVAAKKGQAELLSEMQEMVMILKNRGETISKLEQRLLEKEEEIKDISSTFNSKNNQLQDEVKRLTEEIAVEKSNMEKIISQSSQNDKKLANITGELQAKTILVNQLKNELSKMDVILKEKDEIISTHEQDLLRLRENQENDTLSTSTISRTEEINRLKDVEESFEDRYVKLKAVACKLKRKTNDLTQQLEMEKNRFATERSELQQKIQQLTSNFKNTQCLQQELDKACDNVELYQNDLKSLQKSLDEEKINKITLKEELDQLKREVSEKQNEIENLSKEKTALKMSVDTLSREVEKLKKESTASETISQEKEKELNKMREKLLEKEKEMISTNQQLEQAYGATKKQNILNLELQDYEKTVADLKQQLNVEKCKVKNLKDELNVLHQGKTTLNDQIGALETQVSLERSKNSKLVKSLSVSEKNLKELESSVCKYKSQVVDLNTNYEKEKSHSEELSLQVADLSSELARSKQAAENQHKFLLEQISSLSSQLDKTKKLLVEANEECETLKKEFQAYKIRVHSVLEKHKRENVDKKEEELVKMRIEQLEESNHSLKLQLSSISVELETTKLDLNKALSDKESSERNLKEIKQSVIKKNRELDECKNELKSLQLKTDLLVSCHKTQIEELKCKSENELRELQEKLEGLQNQAATKADLDPMKDSSESLGAKSNVDFEVSATREEGEGSESTDLMNSPVNVISNPRRQTIMPLDQLLESNDINNEDDSVQIDELKHNLLTYQSQIQHLSTLLNESEKNCARNEQLNSFLKEEIRRLERSLERQPHIANSEYLKNVIFKFVTLQNGDERSRLVPVLDTILKLSPDESKKLTAVAKGLEMPSGWNFLGW